jgi:hypothetical protein
MTFMQVTQTSPSPRLRGIALGLIWNSFKLAFYYISWTVVVWTRLTSYEEDHIFHSKTLLRKKRNTQVLTIDWPNLATKKLKWKNQMSSRTFSRDSEWEGYTQTSNWPLASILDVPQALEFTRPKTTFIISLPPPFYPFVSTLISQIEPPSLLLPNQSVSVSQCLLPQSTHPPDVSSKTMSWSPCLQYPLSPNYWCFSQDNHICHITGLPTSTQASFILPIEAGMIFSKYKSNHIT